MPKDRHKTYSDRQAEASRTKKQEKKKKETETETETKQSGEEPSKAE
jgi:hypothetical protein